MMRTPKSISLAFAGGGTGGHFFPAVAIANRVSELAGDGGSLKIVFAGTARGIEYRMRDTLGYPLKLVRIRGLVRSFTFKNLLVPFLMIGALIQSRAILKEAAPDLVIGTGGYVSWPLLRMASFMNIPTVLQEQNSYPGVTTRQLASKATRIYLGFDEARQFLPTDAPIMTTGNPVRRDVLGGDRLVAQEHFDLDKSRKTILVLGGSLGARSINRAVLKSLKAGSLPGEYQLLWQTGKLDYEDVVAQLGDEIRGHAVFPFESRMDLTYAAADLALARAGAISLAEIQALALPSLLIPYPFAAGDHQRHNAQACARGGLAEVIDPDDLGGADVLARAVALFENGQVETMRQKMKQKTAGAIPAVDVIAEDIIRIVAQKQEAAVDR